MSDPNQLPLMKRIADALERLAPASPASAPLDKAEAFVWHADGARLEAVANVSRIELDLFYFRNVPDVRNDNAVDRAVRRNRNAVHDFVNWVA